jgi:hypothetical protein
MDDVEWSDWSEGTEELCTQDDIQNQTDIEDVIYVREYDNDSILALLDYESAYVQLIEENLCLENDNSCTIAKQTNSTCDDMDSVASLIHHKNINASLAESFYKGINQSKWRMMQFHKWKQKKTNWTIFLWLNGFK